MTLVLQGSAMPKPSATVWNHPRITLMAHITLGYEVTPNGGKPLGTTCVTVFFCYLYVRSQRELQTATIL